MRGAHRKDYDEAVTLYESGLSIADVAKHYGISRQSMHKILQRRNVKFRSQLRYDEDNHFYRGGPIADAEVHDKLEHAIQAGKIKKQYVCEVCGYSGVCKDGRSAVQAHHYDYNKPYDVMWLCKRCHYEWHQTHRAIPAVHEESREGGDFQTEGGPAKVRIH